jgi:endoglucanase
MRAVFLLLFPVVGAWLTWTAAASEMQEVLPLTDRIVMIHFNDGHVIHHQRGQSRSDEKVVTSPLDIAAANNTSSYSISSPDDPRYREERKPVEIGRKSKGTDFAWFADRWENGHAVNTRQDHTEEHWLYLFLAEGMRRGSTYSIETGPVASNGTRWPLVFDEAKTRSEAVHVNLIGYVPTAPQKFGYVYHWLGDKAGLNLAAASRWRSPAPSSLGPHRTIRS